MLGAYLNVHTLVIKGYRERLQPRKLRTAGELVKNSSRENWAPSTIIRTIGAVTATGQR